MKKFSRANNAEYYYDEQNDSTAIIILGYDHNRLSKLSTIKYKALQKHYAVNFYQKQQSNIIVINPQANDMTLEDIKIGINNAPFSLTDDIFTFIYMHGLNSNGNHLVALSEHFGTRTDDVFKTLKNAIGHKHNLSIMMSSCESGASVKDAESIFPKGTVFMASSSSDQLFYSDGVNAILGIKPASAIAGLYTIPGLKLTFTIADIMKFNFFQVATFGLFNDLEAEQFLDVHDLFYALQPFNFFGSQEIFPNQAHLPIQELMLYQYLPYKQSYYITPTLFRIGIDPIQNLSDKVEKLLEQPLFFPDDFKEKLDTIFGPLTNQPSIIEYTCAHLHDIQIKNQNLEVLQNPDVYFFNSYEFFNNNPYGLALGILNLYGEEYDLFDDYNSPGICENVT